MIFKIGMNSIPILQVRKPRLTASKRPSQERNPDSASSPDSILSIYYWLLTIIGGHFWTPETMWCVKSFANIVSFHPYKAYGIETTAQVWLLRKQGSESEVCCLKKGLEPAHGSCQCQHSSSRYLYCITPLSWNGQCHVGEVSEELEPGRPSSIRSLKSASCSAFCSFCCLFIPPTETAREWCYEK